MRHLPSTPVSLVIFVCTIVINNSNSLLCFVFSNLLNCKSCLKAPPSSSRMLSPPTWIHLAFMFALVASCLNEPLQLKTVDYRNISFSTLGAFSSPILSIKKENETLDVSKLIEVRSKEHSYRIIPANISNNWSVIINENLENFADFECMNVQKPESQSTEQSKPWMIKLLHSCSTVLKGNCQLFYRLDSPRVYSSLNLFWLTLSWKNPFRKSNNWCKLLSTEVHYSSGNQTVSVSLAPVSKKETSIYMVAFESNSGLGPSQNLTLFLRHSFLWASDHLNVEMIMHNTHQEYRSAYLLSFEKGDWLYSVTVQNRSNSRNHDPKHTTWLARWCISRPGSWIQIKLECSHSGKQYHVANFGTLAVTANGTSYNDMELREDTNQSDYLYLSFYDAHNKSSSFCRYSLDKLSRELTQASEQCHFAQQPTAGLIEAMQYSPDLHTSCTRIEKRFDDFVCNPHPNNRFIESHITHSQEALFVIHDDEITSIFAVTFVDPFGGHYLEQNKTQLIVGTRGGRIINLIVPENAKTNKPKLLYATRLSPHVYGKIIRHNPLLNVRNLSLVMASSTAIFSVPLQGCHIFSSCGACNSNDCAWVNSECQAKRDANATLTCAPIVHRFQPKLGLIEGGTAVTFYGHNFGEPDYQADRDHNRLQIMFDDVPCKVHHRTNEMVKCQLPKSNLEGNNGKITLEAVAQKSDKLPFPIDGKIELEDKFIFVTPLVGGDKKKELTVTAFISLGFLAMVCLGLCLFFKFKKRTREHRLTHKLREHFLKCFDNDNFFKQLQSSNRLISPEKLRKTKHFDSGNFSTVYKALYANKLVAIKVIKLNSPEQQQEKIAEFLEEAEFMKDFDHKNVISLLGITTFPELPAIVTPFMMNGKLLSYLRREDSNITIHDFYNFALQIAKGMQYLAERKLVHRDLAARNVLIDENFVLKVADFGLTRRYKDNAVYYRQSRNSQLPMGWMAPESLEEGFFDIKSDVWSFGVVLWEILACGHQPWSSVKSLDEIGLLLKKGCRLSNPMPEAIPDELFQLAHQCWNDDPNARPTFKQIIDQIDHILSHNPEEEKAGYYKRRLDANPDLPQPPIGPEDDQIILNPCLVSVTVLDQPQPWIEMTDLNANPDQLRDPRS